MFASLPIPRETYDAVVADRRRRGLPAPGSLFGMRPNPLDPDAPAKFHAGVDVACATGTPLLAVDDGVVVEARLTESAGHIIRYRTALGVVSAMHLDGPAFASVGEAVRAGERIGTTGATGRVTGPHLHLEFKPAGASSAVDPLPFFPVGVVGGGGGGVVLALIAAGVAFGG